MKDLKLVVKLELPLRKWAAVEDALEKLDVKVKNVALIDEEALKALKKQAPRRRPKRLTAEDVNRARDLKDAGKSPKAIAKQLGYQQLAIKRLLAGTTHRDVPYVPSEFALAKEKRRPKSTSK